MATIQGIKGKQFTRASNLQDYKDWAYQYATTTYEVDHDMNPGLIIQPESKEDIKLAIAYAKANKKAIAIRTGGHQYSGASSTGSDNIQLDLRNTFRAPDDLVHFQKGSKSYVRASVSHGLGEFNTFLGQHQVFVPHGQCIEVHLGGHVQTGGYGQLGRSFGLFGDHVRSLEIIDHAGCEKEITKSQDPELFHAWLGGSPGNLGVLTHFTLEVNRDSDYVGAVGARILHLYTPSKLKELVGYLAKMSDDPDFPRNYDLCISVLSESGEILNMMGGLDNEMEERHPEIFGKDRHLTWQRMIVIYAQWVPFSKTDVVDDKVRSWFKQFMNAAAPQPLDPKPMSKLTSQWIFGASREFDLPYVKRTYVTKSTDLSTNGWVDWVVDRMEIIAEPSVNDGNVRGQWLSAQLQCFGGKNSQFTKNAHNGTAYSWRDQTMCMTIDSFHTPEKRAEALAWQKGNDEQAIGPNGLFSKQDRRVLWGSWGSFDLNATWRAYYDNEEKYKRIQEARRVADPDGTFTPNTFAVSRACRAGWWASAKHLISSYISICT